MPRDIRSPSMMAPGAFVDIDLSAAPPPPDLPRYPDVTVEEEVHALLLYHFRGRIGRRQLLDEMGAHATDHVKLRGIAKRVRLHPQKRCGCTCTKQEVETFPSGSFTVRTRQICPSLVPKHPPWRDSHGMPRVTCACGGCVRGYRSPDACRWLDWSEPVLGVVQ